MKIGVSGASGKLGKAVLAELVARGGHEVVAISRTPDGMAGIEARLGNYDRPETLVSAYAGLDRLLLIPSSDLARGARSRQNRAAIEAAVEAGVGHIVFLSAAGTKAAEDPALEASYWAGEQALIAKAKAWTVLRMNYYAESLADEVRMSATHGVLVGLGENRVAFVSRDDIAAAAAGMLTGEGHHGAIYNLTGPEALTGADRATIAADVTGQPIGFQVVSEDGLRTGMARAGLPPFVIDVVVGIQSSFVAGNFDIVTGDVEKLSGKPARPLSMTLTAALGR